MFYSSLQLGQKRLHQFYHVLIYPWLGLFKVESVKKVKFCNIHRKTPLVKSLFNEL